MNNPALCHGCEFPAGAPWAHVNPWQQYDACEHVEGLRYCNSCSQYWWRPGNSNTWDQSAKNPDQTVCAREDCPECIEANALEQAPTGLSVELHPWPAGQTPLVVVHEAGRALLEEEQNSNNTQEGQTDETRDRDQEDPG